MKPGYLCWFSDCVLGWKKWGSISEREKYFSFLKGPEWHWSLHSLLFKGYCRALTQR